jgi:hypothetical protein
MTQIYKSILSDIEIQEILSCPETIKAKTSIDNKSSGCVPFDIPLTDNIKTILLDKMGLNLIDIDTISMRWIKGDIPQHVDKGVERFECTHFVHLTDSKGKFIINDVSHPILKGCGFSFNEGIPHETIDTGNTPRLLIGPISEKGFRVEDVGVPDPGIEVDIDKIPRTMGTFTFDNISFDGDIWTLGTMSSKIFIEFPEFYQFGNWRFYKS